MPTPTASRQRSRAVLVAVPVVTGALFAAYAGFRWATDDGPPPTPERQLEARAPPQAPPVGAVETPQQPPPQAAVPTPEAVQAPPSTTPPPTPPPPRDDAPSPEVVARATEEVKAQIESLRPRMAERCAPAGGNENAQLVFRVDFDAAGRETGRVIRPRHRASGRAMARCLLQVDGLELSIQPPGTNVAVAVPFTLP